MLPADLQSPRTRSPITYAKVLLVEGADAFYFFKGLLIHLGLLSVVEVRNYGGGNDLTAYLDLLRVTPGFERVTSLGIIRDAEQLDATRVFRSVSDSLKQVNLPVPPQPLTLTDGLPAVSVFILPDCAGPGALETLCLQSVSGDPALPCVDEYFQCVQRQGHALPNNLLKARLHAFLSSRAQPNLRLGQAAHEGYWPWENVAFDLLKQF